MYNSRFFHQFLSQFFIWIHQNENLNFKIRLTKKFIFLVKFAYLTIRKYIVKNYTDKFIFIVLIKPL